MTNINDLGLPQGLPEAWGSVSGGYQIVGEYGIKVPRQPWHDSWWPAETTPNPRFFKPREMTAADLGLPHEPVVVWLWRRGEPLRATDAPYSFWLGADQ